MSMEEEAKRLKINILISPWMFNYRGLGWGYQPTSKEQWEFFDNYGEHYPDDNYFNWICQSRNSVLK